MGFVYKKKSGNLGLKGGEEGERGGSWVGVLWLDLCILKIEKS